MSADINDILYNHFINDNIYTFKRKGYNLNVSNEYIQYCVKHYNKRINTSNINETTTITEELFSLIKQINNCIINVNMFDCLISVKNAHRFNFNNEILFYYKIDFRNAEEQKYFKWLINDKHMYEHNYYYLLNKLKTLNEYIKLCIKKIYEYTLKNNDFQIFHLFCRDNLQFYMLKVFKRYMTNIRNQKSYKHNPSNIEGYLKTIYNNLLKLTTYLIYDFKNHKLYDLFVNIHNFPIIFNCFRNTPLLKYFNINEFNKCLLGDDISRKIRPFYASIIYNFLRYNKDINPRKKYSYINFIKNDFLVKKQKPYKLFKQTEDFKIDKNKNKFLIDLYENNYDLNLTDYKYYCYYSYDGYKIKYIEPNNRIDINSPNYNFQILRKGYFDLFDIIDYNNYPVLIKRLSTKFNPVSQSWLEINFKKCNTYERYENKTEFKNYKYRYLKNITVSLTQFIEYLQKNTLDLNYDLNDFIQILKVCIKTKQFRSTNLLFDLIKNKPIEKLISNKEINSIIYYFIKNKFINNAMFLLNKYYNNQSNETENETGINQFNETGINQFNEPGINQSNETENETKINQFNKPVNETGINQSDETGINKFNETEINQSNEPENETGINQSNETGINQSNETEINQSNETGINQSNEPENETEINQSNETKINQSNETEINQSNETGINQSNEPENETEINQSNETGINQINETRINQSNEPVNETSINQSNIQELTQKSNYNVIHNLNISSNSENNINNKFILKDDNPNIQETLLYAAIINNYTNIVKLLLNQNFKYKFSKTDFKNSLLYISFKNRNSTISELLINNGHQYDYPKCNFKETPLYYAFKFKLYKIIKLLINKGVRLNYQHNQYKNTPLKYAIFSKNEDIINSIINKNVKINYCNLPFNKTPLYDTIRYKLINSSLLLINKGIRINYKKDIFEHTPLYLSIKNELEPVSLLLINKGVKIRYLGINDSNKTVLGYATYYGPPSIVNALTEKGCLKDLIYSVEHHDY